MFVAEAFLSSFFEVALDKLVASPLLEYARRHKVDAELNQWRRTLLQIQAVLNDAEQKQLGDSAVKMWLDDLRSVAYDIEDVLDEFNTEGLKTSTTKVRKLIPSLHPSSLILNNKIGRKIKNISQELDLIVQRKSNLHLREGVGGISTVNEERLTTSLVDESGVYGRDADKEKMLELVLSDDEATTAAHKVRVIPIVGMGGIGKTTLAQIVYNDERVKDNFSVRAWVCVSDRFDLAGTTKAILESVTKSPTDTKNLQLLQEKLKKELSGRKFFLVLDDIWNENPNSWSSLLAPLVDGEQGSVILVTTRQQHVASIMRTTSFHHLSQLSDEDCWSLFAHLAFENITADARQNLEPVGRKIIKKCKGLPLAAKTLGGLLRSRQDENGWKEMLNSEIWNLPAEQSSILPALHLSYHYLPTKYKRCFAYCSLFPKDYDFVKEELILLWAAEGLLDSLKRGETLEEVGETCFHNLLLRSFFQQSGHDESFFVMHDLIHDLAQYVSGDLFVRLGVEKQNQDVKKARHFSYIRNDYDVSLKFYLLHETYNMRTFLPSNKSRDISTCHLANKILWNLLPKLRYLRVLSLSHYKIDCLPDSFGKLKHLRYLDLSYTAIKELPKWIGMLLNLQTLKLSNCYLLTELPSEISKLINLRHFDISETNLEGMPRGIDKLKDLRRLSRFVVGKDSAARIKELRDLSCLAGALTISNLHNVVHVSDVSEANLKNKKDIDDLVFEWDGNATVGDAENQTRVLENLQPHEKLRRLSIEYYYGVEFPNWLGNDSFMNLVFLQLRNCKNCLSLPPLGQLQSLKELLIVGMHQVRKVGAELYGDGCGSSSFKPFSSLVILKFEEMMEWEEWVCCGVEFPCLKELHMLGCPKLKEELPKHLPILTNLVIMGCGQLVCRLPIAPCICELVLHECDDAVVKSAGELTSMTFLGVGDICKVPVELGQLHSLTRLMIYGCRELKELPSIFHNLTSLEKLRIALCESLSSLQEMGLPPMLEALDIEDCSNLEFLPEALNSVTSLRKLKLKQCEKLDLKLGDDMMHNLYASLTELIIDKSGDHLTSFPLASFTKLESLTLYNCEKLETLFIPDRLHHMELTSLREIDIVNCPNLVSFPQGGLPTPNLSILKIGRCEKLMGCRKEWGLQRLPSLRTLALRGIEEGEEEERLESFPEVGLLPSTLTELGIMCFPNVKRLNAEGLQHLTSLECLYISDCKKLKHLPKQGLPSSIIYLMICKCPVLKKRYSKRGKGRECSNISNIPAIIFDDGEEGEGVFLS